MSMLVYSIAKGEDPQDNFIELSKNQGFIYWDNAKFKKINPGDKVFITNVSKGNWYLTELINNNIPIIRDVIQDCITFNDDGYLYTVPDAQRWGNFVKLKIIEKIENEFSPYKNTGAGCSTFMENDGANGEIRIKQLLEIFNKETSPQSELLLNNLLEKTSASKMYKYYLKKASKQDFTKTTVINNDAAKYFFEVSLQKRDDEAVVSINYFPENIIDNEVIISKKQDIRIFIDRSRFKEGDILLFTSRNRSLFNLEIIGSGDNRYELYNSVLSHNYLLTNSLNFKNSTMTDLFNQTTNKDIPMNYPLNQILYGPPGTGKTYSTITKALNIIGLLEEKDTYTNEEYAEAQELFQNELGKRIEFVTMHQSFSYEDFVQGLKPLKPEEGEGIAFDYKNGVFKDICERADENRFLDKNNSEENETLIDKLFPSFYLSIDENSVCEILKEKVYEGKNVPQYLAIEYFNKKLGKKYCKAWRDKFDYIFGEKSPRVGYQPDKFREGELEDFTKYSEKFEKLTSDERKEKLISEWIDDKPQTISTSNELNNHVIILDEINRANISRVFGELIALIEKDKRDGKLKATLPSGEPFTVPSNLYIIGTMNTADKSIALVDIALRRRFEFKALYPDPEILKKVLEENEFSIDDIIQRVSMLNNLNRIIRAKKSVDFEIGHSYFMDDDTLVNILNKQVMPLLNEYFMYDLKKVKDIIKKQQKDSEGNLIPNLGIILNEGVWSNRGLLEVDKIEVFENLQMVAEGGEKYGNL